MTKRRARGGGLPRASERGRSRLGGPSTRPVGPRSGPHSPRWLRSRVEWWPGPESNQRHPHFQCGALPTELPGPGLRGRRPNRKLSIPTGPGEPLADGVCSGFQPCRFDSYLSRISRSSKSLANGQRLRWPASCLCRGDAQVGIGQATRERRQAEPRPRRRCLDGTPLSFSRRRDLGSVRRPLACVRNALQTRRAIYELTK